MEQKQLEYSEIQKLINDGFPIKISYQEITNKKWWQFWKKPEVKNVEETFVIKELTLSILDRIALESIELRENDDDFENEESIKRYSRKHYKRVARIIAMAMLGENLEIAVKDSFGNLNFKVNEKELQRLTNILMKVCKPSMIYGLLDIIDIESNLTDFKNSTRKLTAVKQKVTMTDLVEKKESAD